MQLSRHAKNIGAIGLLMTGLSPALAQSSADEAAARAKAQEELRQKMSELDTQVPGARQAAPAVSNSGKLSAAAQAAAEAEMQKKLAELNHQPAPATVAPVKPAMVMPPAVSPATPVKMIPAPVAAPVAPVPAKSTDNLDAARQQMREKMTELNTSSAPVAPAAPVVIETHPAPVAAPVATPMVQETPAAVPSGDIAAAQAAMREKLAGMQPPAAPAAPVAPVAPAVTFAPAAPAVVAAPAEVAPVVPVTPAPEAVDDIKLAAARAQMEHSLATAKPVPPTEPAEPGAPVFAPAPSTASRAAAEKEALRVAAQKSGSTVTPTAETLMAAPPPAVSASKEQRLQGLLQLYKADQLSPEQYHTERAKILAEP